jgi:hypothetical protein
MPLNVLEACRTHLEKSYRQKLNYEFLPSVTALKDSRQPAWRFVSIDDLTGEVGSESPGAAGLVLDPEIGLLLYLVPFDSGANLRNQIACALGLRSRLSAEKHYTGNLTADSDTRGSWRVAIHWLVKGEELKQRWVEQVMEVRRETGFSEEISFDAIFFTSDAGLGPQLEEFGFPRLLLTTRELLAKPQLDDVAKWMSADTLVKDTLRDFEDRFQAPEQRELAAEVVRAMEGYEQQPSSPIKSQQPPSAPARLRSIRVRSFRNLHDVHLDFGISPVTARVIHGPNGTGKSSFCEALSLAMFGSSFRYKNFANRERERDIGAADRAGHYMEEYLRPVDAHSAKPETGLNQNPCREVSLVPPEGVEEADWAMCGTILTQGASGEFARMSSDELGARVLREYSGLADYIEEFTYSRVTQADTARQEFLRRIGLYASITRLETACERIARQTIDESLPTLPEALVAWLESAPGLRAGSDLTNLHDQWRAWGGNEARSHLARELGAPQNRDEVESKVRVWLEEFNVIAWKTSEFLKHLAWKVDLTSDELDTASKQINTWGDWLERRAQGAQAPASGEAESLARTLQEIQAQQQGLTERGQHARMHLDHLVQAESFVRQSWAKTRSEECPTCGARHSDPGGVLRVIESLRVKTAAERDALREEHLKLKVRIEEAQRKLSALGQAQCPLTSEEQSRVAQAAASLLPENVTVEHWISVKARREELLKTIAVLRRMPSAPAQVSVDAEGRRIAVTLAAEFQKAGKVLEGPNSWKAVKANLTRTLAEIVNRHLPTTLTRLWCELALNLTPAPWLLPERPSIAITTGRGEQKASLRVRDRLARYILNESEIHILGLAWFFARYVTFGRFYQAVMVMDDPAQELDQTSFRDLCRLWETWVRLHRVYERPLTLVLLLNQESRALDAARATDGLLALFGWTREQKDSIRAISVVGEGFYPPEPMRLFRQSVRG